MPAASCPTWRNSHQHRAAQPEPSSSARTKDAGPTPARQSRQLLDRRQRMAATVGRIRADRRQVGLGVEVDRPGKVAGLESASRTNVDEDDAHSAPRGATSSSSTTWSGNRSRRSAAQRSPPRPTRSRSGRTPTASRRATRRRLGPDRREHGRRPVGLCSQSSSAAATAASPLAAPAPSRAARPALAAASAWGTVAGSACASLGRGSLPGARRRPRPAAAARRSGRSARPTLA